MFCYIIHFFAGYALIQVKRVLPPQIKLEFYDKHELAYDRLPKTF